MHRRLHTEKGSGVKERWMGTRSKQPALLTGATVVGRGCDGDGKLASGSQIHSNGGGSIGAQPSGIRRGSIDAEFSNKVGKVWGSSADELQAHHSAALLRSQEAFAADRALQAQTKAAA